MVSSSWHGHGRGPATCEGANFSPSRLTSKHAIAVPANAPFITPMKRVWHLQARCNPGVPKGISMYSLMLLAAGLLDAAARIGYDTQLASSHRPAHCSLSIPSHSTIDT